MKKAREVRRREKRAGEGEKGRQQEAEGRGQSTKGTRDNSDERERLDSFPTVFCQIDSTLAAKPNPFIPQPDLLLPVAGRRAHADFPLRVDDSMPGHPGILAGAHRPADRACAARHSQRAGDLTVGHDAPARDSPHERVNALKERMVDRWMWSNAEFPHAEFDLGCIIFALGWVTFFCLLLSTYCRLSTVDCRLLTIDRRRQFQARHHIQVPAACLAALPVPPRRRRDHGAVVNT
jgi:hypothetical protein